MNEVRDLVSWTGALGTPAQIGSFVVLVLALLKISVPWRQQTIDKHEREIARLLAGKTELKEEIKQLRADCDVETEGLKKEIQGLKDQIHGMRDQRNAEQLAIIRGILETVESPELRKQLVMLESVGLALKAGYQELPGVKDDAKRS